MNRQFGALRGLAILMVVLYHSIDLGVSMPQGWGYPPIEGLGRLVLSLKVDYNVKHAGPQNIGPQEAF